MRQLTTPGRTQLLQSRRDVLALPIFLAIVILAVAVRQFFGRPSVIVLAVCGGAFVLLIPLSRFIQRNGAATLIVTADDITFTRVRPGGKDAPEEVMQRAADSRLSFRLQSNGFVGNQPSYLLKLRDQATGKELPVTGLGRRPVRQACESQGWQFSD
jgi:hypothetical protein